MHSYNGIFGSDKLRLECYTKNKQQYLSGVVAQHNNVREYRSIKTIMYMARTFMVQSSLRWIDHGEDDISLWYFSVKHAVCLHNQLPNYRSGITSLEFLIRNKSDHLYLRRSHVWGCPILVLDPKMQNYQNIPKWNWRSILGQFLGFSEQHSSIIANVHNPKTGHISPQYHVFFDNLFETVYITGEIVLNLMQFTTTYLITKKIGKFWMIVLNRGS